MSRLAQPALLGLLGALYIATSSGLITFNKYLMHADRFPFSVSLVLMHSLFCSVLTGLLYLLRPSLFPSIAGPAEGRVAVDRELLLKGAAPIAFFFTAQLVLSNTAYLHSSVAFIQMMKESNLVFVYILSLLVAIERFKVTHVFILFFVLAATDLTIHGEKNFNLQGFVIQGLGQLFECARIVLQAVLLTSVGKKLDALSYVLLVMPLCFCFLAVSLIGLTFVWPNDNFPSPKMQDLYTWWPYLLLNSLIAFALNVVIALFIKNSEAVSFILAGILKDAMIVLVGGLGLGESISRLQVAGFGMQIVGILIWSLMKTFPESFEDGFVAGFVDVLRGREQAKKAERDKISGEQQTEYGTTPAGRP